MTDSGLCCTFVSLLPTSTRSARWNLNFLCKQYFLYGRLFQGRMHAHISAFPDKMHHFPQIPASQAPPTSPLIHQPAKLAICLAWRRCAWQCAMGFRLCHQLHYDCDGRPFVFDIDLIGQLERACYISNQFLGCLVRPKAIVPLMKTLSLVLRNHLRGCTPKISLLKISLLKISEIS